MMLAPQPLLHAVSRSYSSGVRGVGQTVRIMRQLVRAGRIDPKIRQAATTIIFLSPEKQDHLEASQILAFMQASIRYTKDIHDVETISSAEKTLEGRIGDCDDQSVLLASLLESVGYPTRFVVAAYEAPGMYEHVYVQVCVEGEWLDADPTERYPLGVAPPDPLTVMIEKV